jgi:hypothetical protein
MWVYVPPPPAPEKAPPGLADEVKRLREQLAELTTDAVRGRKEIEAAINGVATRVSQEADRVRQKIETTPGFKSTDAVKKSSDLGLNFEEESRAIRRESEQLAAQQRQLDVSVWTTKNGAEPWEKRVEEVRKDADRRVGAVRDEITTLQFVIGLELVAWQREALIRVLNRRLEDLEV